MREWKDLKVNYPLLAYLAESLFNTAQNAHETQPSDTPTQNAHMVERKPQRITEAWSYPECPVTVWVRRDSLRKDRRGHSPA